MQEAQQSSPQLVVGLGNPGPKYSETRHNAGFWFLDQLAGAYNGVFRADAKFHGEVCQILCGGEKIWLLKPGTFMNNSGRAVKALAGFYRIPAERILVVHDELDLSPGCVRLKHGGGHGGHNGLRDSIACLGSREFMRLRVGIGHPGDAKQVVDYVLHRAGLAEQKLIEQSLHESMRVFPDLAVGDWDRAVRELHSSRN